MKKEILVGSLLVLILVLMLGFVIADGSSVLSEDAGGVSTSNGILDLPEGTLVGGNPSNYITLSADTTMATTTGNQTFTNGTKIDCDHAPGEQDPCDPF